MYLRIVVAYLFLSSFFVVNGQNQLNKTYKIYQFPKDKIPRIDGDFQDWSIVPDSYAIGLDQLMDTKFGHGTDLDPQDFDIKVKVGWVNGLDRLYFFLEMDDDYWDFDDPSLGQDIFELVVDADLSGGPFINEYNGNMKRFSKNELYFKGHGAHAQNYHIFTPVKDKDWAMVWGNTPWIKDFPYSNVAYDYNFKQAENGKLKMEFWITPFDYAAQEGFQRSVTSTLKEQEFIGLSWSMLDFDGEQCEAFMNLAHTTKMIYDASYLNLFKLMPLEKRFQPELQANWKFIELDRESRTIQFMDKSVGEVQKQHWDFGDGTFSEEKNPKHTYAKEGLWTVKLCVEDSENKDCLGKVWEVVTK